MRRAWLIAGSAGMLGTALQRVLVEEAERVVALPRAEFDVTDPAASASVISDFARALEADERGVFVNAAAYTDVEGAEEHREAAFAVNAYAPTRLAAEAREAGVDFVHISTDFVFDGSKPGPYGEDDAVHPLSVYGTSKLAGERGVEESYPDALIVRAAWVFGPGGTNFPGKVLSLASERGELSVVTDEIGSPTYTIDLAGGIAALARLGVSGIYHLAGAGACSRFELAEEALRLAGVDAVLRPVDSEAFPSRAARPANSVLDCSKAAALGVTLPAWQDALRRFLAP